MADKRMLFCVYDGNPPSRSFQVKIEADFSFSELAQKILEMSKIPFDPSNVPTLWSVDLSLAEMGSNINIDSYIGDKEMLDPRKSLSTLPQNGVTYIIIKLSSPGASLVGTLPPTNVSEALAKIVDNFFASDSDQFTFLKEFVQGSKDLPVTGGGVSGLPCVRKRGDGKVRTAPSMLFFYLPSPDDSDDSQKMGQAEEFLSKYGRQYLPLFSVSGCGKTRTAINLLSKSWGLYFNAGAEDLGSGDMTSALEVISEYAHIYLTPTKTQNTDNTTYLIYCLLYARLSILEYCLNIVGSKDTFTCKRWMLLQVATPVFRDVFLELFVRIRMELAIHAATGAIDMVQSRFRNVKALLSDRLPPRSSHNKFLVILDESQTLGRRHEAMFLGSDRITPRPVLAPVLFAFRRLSIPSGFKLSAREYEVERLSSTVVEFDGWTNIDLVAAYVRRIGDSLSVDARARLQELIPLGAIRMLYRDLRGRFRPIVDAIEDIIERDEPDSWRQCIELREYRLTTAVIPKTSDDKRALEGNLCGELRRVFERANWLINTEESKEAQKDLKMVQENLRTAMATFITQGGYKAFSGKLPKLVESAFGRIRTTDGVFETVIDEPFAFKAADNYFQLEDEDYATHRRNLMYGCPAEQIRGKLWEFSITHEMVRLFEGRIVPRRLFRDGVVPHNMMHLVSSIMGWTGQMRTTREEEIPLAEFLNAHINNNSLRNDEAVPPFIFPREHDSGPDLAFVVQFGDIDIPSQYVCPVFVQVKLVQDLYCKTRQEACSTVQPEKISGGHNVDIRQFCGEHGHYISIIVAFPAKISQFFKNKPVLEYHPDFGVTQIALVIDHSNISLLDKKHVSAVKYMKRCADEMSEEVKEEEEEQVVVNTIKRRRSQ